MRIIVTGCRDWMWPDLVEAELEQLYGDLEPDELLVVVHGDCPTGADRYAKEWVEQRRRRAKQYTTAHRANPPPDHDPYPYKRELGKRGGPARNQEMANNGADLCVAYWDGVSTGTLDMITRAVLAGIRVVIVPAPHPIPRNR